jgi:hypothetical protein
MSPLSPSRTDEHAITQPIEKQFNLGEARTHMPGETDRQLQVDLF